MSLRIGQGYDSHRLVPGRPLILGGITIEHELGLDGHSDADVLAHAVADALLGAAGLGDLGTLFPDDDPVWEGADSIELLAEVCRRVGGRVLNCDATVICEQPRLAPHREAMERKLGDVCGAPVSVKATTNEGMGAIGRGEGIAAIASVLVDLD